MLALSPALLGRLEAPGPRYTSYPTVPAWSSGFGADDYGAALARAGERRPTQPLSLYVHLPFCHELCSYCGCYVVITRDRGRVERYLDGVAGEIALAAERLGARRTVSRLHLGGGTPTFLDEAQLERLWRALTARFAILPDAELSIEVNPVGTRRTQLELLAEHGFNRLSIGVQDFDPAVQAAVRRVQTVEETRATMQAARLCGFRSINLDLICGLPRQTPESFRRTVAEVVALAPERVAVFSFAYVPSLKPHQRRLPLADLPSPAAKLELSQVAAEVLTGAGYRAIGMDHFARPDDELARAQERGALGRDFQGYTTERTPETVAFGASAISALGDCYAQNEKSLGEYERAIAAGRFATERGIRLAPEDVRRRQIICDLMCNFAVDLDRYGAGFSDELAALAAEARSGLVELDGRRVQVTPLGRHFIRNLAGIFDQYPA